MLDQLSSSSQAFLSTCTSLCFAVIVASRASEVLRHFEKNSQNHLHIQGLSLLSGVGLVASALPLILAELPQCFELSSAVFAALSFGLILHTLSLRIRRRMYFVFPVLSWVLIIASTFFGLALAALALKYVPSLYSQTLYKSLLGWLLFVLSIRLYLVIGHVFVSSQRRARLGRKSR
jgi:hypothetical protein